MNDESLLTHYAISLGLPLTNCRIRVSSRAKHGQLRVLDQGLVEAVIPQGWSNGSAEKMISENQDWLQKHLKIAENRRNKNPQRFKSKPDYIDFKAINECWQLSYQKVQSGAKLKADHSLADKTIMVKYCNNQILQKLLHTWMARKAKYHLQPWLEKISKETGLQYNKVSFRTQKTRWGSCSHQKNISLNRCLLFLDPLLVDYLFVHELCHTLHPNHSKSFWGQVEAFIPDYKDLDKRLNQATELIPLWAISDHPSG